MDHQSTHSPLLRQPFAGFFLARLVSLLGSAMAPVALAFGVLDVAGGLSDLGIVLAAQVGPQLVLLLVGGAIADRFSRRNVLIVANLGAGLTQAGVAVVLLSGSYSLPLVAGLSLLTGALEAFASPALRGIVPELVPPDYLQRANSVLASTRNASRILGPALAGLIVVTFGSGWALAVDALSFLLAVPFLFSSEIASKTPPARGSLLPDIRAGWHVFCSTPWVWSMTLSFCFVNLFNVGPWQVLGPAIVKEQTSEAAWGVLLSLRAVGLLAMGLVMYKLVFQHPLRAGALAGSTGALPLMALGLHASLPTLIACTVIGALGLTVSGVTWETALGQHVPHDVLSRVASYDDLFSYAAVPVSLLLIGPASAWWGSRNVALLCSAGYAAATLAPLLVPSVRALTNTTAEERT